MLNNLYDFDVNGRFLHIACMLSIHVIFYHFFYHSISDDSVYNKEYFCCDHYEMKDGKCVGKMYVASQIPINIPYNCFENTQNNISNYILQKILYLVC